MHSDAATADEYLASLPNDRREALEQVRTVILANLPTGVVEEMNWGMISYDVPLSTHPNTYNGKPLMFAGLVSQKNYMAVYLTSIYGSKTLLAQFEDDYRAAGKRLDMGKSCVRFKTIDDLPLAVIGRAIGVRSLEEFLTMFDNLAAARKGRSKK